MTNALIALPPILFLGGIISVLAGSGLGIILITSLSIFFPIQEAIVLSALLVITTHVGKIAAFYRFIRWDIVQWYVIGGFPAAVIASHFLFFLPTLWVERGLGVFALIFVLLRVVGADMKVTPTRSMIALSGFGNGIVSGLFGDAAALRNIAILSLGLKKEVFISTTTMCAFLVNLGRLTSYVPVQRWDDTLLRIMAVSIPSILLGVVVGRFVLRFVSVVLFERFLLCVIFIGALKFLLSS
jgi:uncharacterized membrane protein YfcA